MFEYKKIVALSILALALVGVTLAAVAINPLIGGLIPPILWGVAKIIEALRGDKETTDSDC